MREIIAEITHLARKILIIPSLHQPQTVVSNAVSMRLYRASVEPHPTDLLAVLASTAGCDHRVSRR